MDDGSPAASCKEYLISGDVNNCLAGVVEVVGVDGGFDVAVVAPCGVVAVLA